MTNEKALKDALGAINSGMLDLSDINPYIETIKEAIEKQIPKKPRFGGLNPNYSPFDGSALTCKQCWDRPAEEGKDNKYIKQSDALKSIDEIAEYEGSKFDECDARYAIQTTPAADVEEVIRCKDCQFYKRGDVSLGDCNRFVKHCVKCNDYCSYGKRKEGNK